MEAISRRSPATQTTSAKVDARDVAPRRHWLRAAGAETILTSAGSGGYFYEGLAVTRWQDDPTCDADGIFLYVRDFDDGRYWSAAWQPTGGEPDGYDVEFFESRAAFRRVESDIEVQLEVAVCAETGIDLRRCTLKNLSDRRRTIELTSYLEWVLQSAAADAAHPAFSKLFVETEFLANERLIVARRRRRDPRDATLVGAHWIVDGGDASTLTADSLQFETSRATFIGRGCGAQNPAALEERAKLSGACGPVLDPAGSLRQTFYLGPNESASITFGLAARREESSLLNLVRNYTPVCAASVFERAVEAANQADHVDVSTGVRVDPAHRFSRGPAYEFERLRDISPAVQVGDEAPQEKLQFDNGLGGFSPDGREYVIRLRPRANGRLELPPTPWSHVVANPQAGFIATETGAGYTWTVNSRENRLTRWRNDPVCDPHSEAIYLREEARRAYWSPTPGPAPSRAMHDVRYGFGFVQYDVSSAQLRQRVVQFVPADDPLKIIDVRLEDASGQPRDIELFFYADLALGNGDANQRELRTWHDADAGVIFLANARRELSHRVSFVAVIRPDRGAAPLSFTSDRTEFLGLYGNVSSPSAVRAAEKLSGRMGDKFDACAAIQAPVRVGANGASRLWVIVGEADDEAAARELIDRYSTAAAVDGALDAVRGPWRELLSAVSIETPSPALNLMVNGWLPYQNISCRMWGRSAYYQSGGAFGFRDQLQDSAALVYHRPALTREQIVRHAGAQFVEGDVLHWWHPPAGGGIRTRFADDLLWLPLVAAEYVATTGDESLWDERAPFLTGAPLEAGEAERRQLPTASGESGPIYEHACRAIDRSLAAGSHGLPLMGCGDWNDGMNRVGADGAGESVWMAFFLDYVLQRMLPVCQARQDLHRVARYREHQWRLRDAIESAAWDGEWFRRAFFGDGAPLGTSADDECQIDALVQAWSVLSGAASRERTLQAIDAVERRLVRADAGLIQLLDPPFDKTVRDPGYIKGYLPGIRENGGQYTHGVLWYIRALAELGRGTRAVELLDMLNPVHHARTADEVAVYQVEPYVIAADVYSQPPHVGRGGWTWYTGSAGWMFRVAVESILGLQIRGGRELVLNPCISAAWPGCCIKYRMPDGGGVYEIAIENPAGRERGVRTATLDDHPLQVENGVARVPLSADGLSHRVRLQL